MQRSKRINDTKNNGRVEEMRGEEMQEVNRGRRAYRYHLLLVGIEDSLGSVPWRCISPKDLDT